MSEVEVNLQVPSSSTKFNTDGRTDRRTKMVVTDVDQLSVVTTRADNDRMATVGEIITAGILRTGERHELLRSGDRDPIPTHVRYAVWLRDRGRCELCSTRQEWLDGPWECDHIIPWSAGGSDDTTNLRVLCQEHNQKRSNFIDPLERPRRPATWWCVKCYSASWETTSDGFPICPIHVGSKYWTVSQSLIDPGYKRCRVMASCLRHLEEHEEVPSWHNRTRVEEPFVVAHCAHCGIPSLTDKPL